MAGVEAKSLLLARDTRVKQNLEVNGGYVADMAACYSDLQPRIFQRYAILQWFDGCRTGGHTRCHVTLGATQ